jgi:MSHA biogenesis protein MshP
MFPERSRGFSTAVAIFLLVVFAVLGAAMVTVSTMQHTETALDIRGARAYQAARAGIEWGLYRALDPDQLIAAASTPPACWAGSPTVTLSGDLAAFTTTVTCSEVNSPADELGKNVRVYLLTATASAGTPGTSAYVERQISVSVSRCADPSNSPTFAC